MAEPIKGSGTAKQRSQIRWTVILLVLLVLAFYAGFFLIMGMR